MRGMEEEEIAVEKECDKNEGKRWMKRKEEVEGEQEDKLGNEQESGRDEGEEG